MKNKTNKTMPNSTFKVKRQRLRIWRRRNQFGIKTPQEEYGVQSLGNGRMSLNIEKLVDQQIVPASVAFFQLGSILQNSTEFIQYAFGFRYFRIFRVAVIFDAQNEVSVQGKTYVMMNWANTETDNLEYEDSSKIVSAYRTRKIKLKFLPPPTNVPTNRGFINIRAWLPAADSDFTYISSHILMQNTTPMTVRARIIIRVLFAGNRVQDPSSLVQRMQALIDNNKVKKKVIKYDGLSKQDEEDEKKEGEVEEDEESILDEGDLDGWN
jgi:hypothetical protein